MRHFTCLLLASAALPFAAHAADAANADGSADIIVTGKGETKQVQQIKAVDIALGAPGISPLKALEMLPSVNFQSADAFGNYEWSERITIRGFNQNAIGFTLDGLPLGDGSYGNVNGLHISRAITSENVDTINVAQGAGSLGAQATNNLGGTLQFTSRPVSDKFGVDVQVSGGSNNTGRGYLRVDTGSLGPVKGWVSFMGSTTDKWRGYGHQRQIAVNAKFQADIGTAKATWYTDYSDRREDDYQDLSLKIINDPARGYYWDNISQNYPLAVQLAYIAANRGDTGVNTQPFGVVPNPAAGTAYPAPYQTVDDAYFDASGLRRDFLTRLTVDQPLTDTVKMSITGYYHSNHGQGTWFLPYVGSPPSAGAPNGVPLSERETQYTIKRGGIFGAINIALGNRDNMEIGLWYESNKATQRRVYFGLGSLTQSTRDPLSFQSDTPFFIQRWLNYGTDTLQYHIKERFHIGSLTVDAGSKGFDVRNSSVAIVAGGQAAGKVSATDWFQPSFGLNYKFGGGFEVFADFAKSVQAFTSGFTAGPFATSQASLDALNAAGTLSPQKSFTYEGGARYSAHGFSASAVIYDVEFKNRLLSVATGVGATGSIPLLQSVGNVRSKGVELTAQYKFTSAISAFVAYDYNASKYLNNYTAGGIVIPVGGKTTVDSPENQLKGSINYDDKAIFGHIDANYMSTRYATYLNDEVIKGRTIVNASAGYRFHGGTFLEGLEISGQVSNLFNTRYIATIGTNGFVNSDPDGSGNPTLLTGAPRSFFATLKKKF